MKYISLKKILFLTLIIIVILCGVYIFNKYFNTKTKFIREEYPKFSIEYLNTFKKVLIENENAGKYLEFLLKLENSEKLQSTPFRLFVTKEVGLRIVTSLTRIPIIDNLLRNSERSFPQTYPEYKKLSERTFEYKGKNSAEIYFTYKGPAGETIKQRFMIIAYDGDTALYVSVQAKEIDFDKLNKKYFDKIYKSLEF